MSARKRSAWRVIGISNFEIHSDRHPDLFWTAATALVQLYAVEKRPEKVRETLTQMGKFLAAKPNRKRAAELAKFRSRFTARGGPPRRQTPVQDH